MAEIALNNVIVHELLKKAREDFDHSNRYNLRKTTLSVINPSVLKLVTEISSLYGARGNQAHYGIFKRDITEQSPVPLSFSNYSISEGDVSKNFIEFTVTIMKQLYEKAKLEHFSSGGYLVFSDYTVDGDRFFLITMIKQKKGLSISEKLEPEELMQLDLSKINQAARISFKHYKEYNDASDEDKSEFNYLSFISKSSGQTSGYFITALGCDKGLASSKATSQLPTEAYNFFSSNIETKSNALSFRKDVVEYMNKQCESERSVKLSDLESIASKYMTYLNEERRDELIASLTSRMNSEEVRIPTEFMASKTSLRKLTNLIYKTKALSFDFDTALLGDSLDAHVCYNESTGVLSFTKLPEEKKLEIKQALEESKKLKAKNN